MNEGTNYFSRLFNWLKFPVYQKHKRLYRSAFIHAGLMLLFTFFWIKLPWVLGEEYGTMGEILHLEHWVQSRIYHPDKSLIFNKYFFIDVSRNNMLARHPKNKIDTSSNTTLVDRIALAQVLKKINKHKEKLKYIVCDIVFEDSTNLRADSILQSAFDAILSNNFTKIVVPITYDDKMHKVFKPCIFSGLKYGVSQYSSFFNNSFYKYQFVYDDSMKQIPLMAYESFEQPTYGFKNLIKRVFRFYNLNTIIPQFRISNTDMEFAQRDGSEKFFYYHMSNLEDDQIDSVDGRIIVIGNFEDKDIHSTMLEKMNGPLIIVNILEGLYEGDNWISLPFLLTTYLVYFFVALYTLAKLTKDYLPHDKKISMNNEHSKPFKRFFYYVFHTIREFILEEKNHFILFIYVIICLTFFHHYIYFLSAEIYILLLSFFIKAWRYSEV